MPGPETSAQGCRRAAPLLEADFSVPDRQTSIDDKLGLLWGALQCQMLELLTHGVAAPFQRRAFDRLDYSMKQYGKLRLERADEVRGEKLGRAGRR